MIEKSVILFEQNSKEYLKKEFPALVCHYCRDSDSSDRPKLEDTTNPTTHGDWRLYVQN
jgi:hypothetical protein